MADGQDGLMPLDFKDPFAAPAARPAAASAAPAQPMKLDFADPFEQAASAAERANHSTLGDIGRSALGALETGTGEGLQGIGDVTGWKGAQNLGKRVQAAGAREAANVSPQFAETTSKPILSKEGFNLTNIGSKAINTIASFAPQSAATLAAGALGGGVAAVPVGVALFGTQGEAAGRNAAGEQVAALTPDELARVPAYQKAIAAGATPDQARAQLSETAQTRGAVSGGVSGAALGLLGEIPGVSAVGKFAANKLVRSVGRVAGASTALASRGAARVVGKGIGEGVGFGGINAAGQVVNNVSNPVPTSPLEGVGEAAASGLLPGFALGAGRAGVQRLLRPAGPLGRAAQTAQDAGATAPAPGVVPAEAAQPAAAGAPATAETPPPVTRKVAPPAVPWVNAETGETRTPAASEIVAAFHRMQDDQAQAAANNQKLVVGLSQLSSAWGVPLERLKSLRRVAINERAKGVTTNDAEQRAAEDFAQQGTTDTFQQADRAIGDLNDQANTVGASLADARARLAALREQPGSESAASNDVAKPEQAPAPNAEPTTPAPDAAAVETTAKLDEAPAMPPRAASAERAPEAPAAETPAASEPATTQPPAAAPAVGATPARAEPASAPADQAAREVPVSSSESSDKSGVGAETTPNVGEKQPSVTERAPNVSDANAAKPVPTAVETGGARAPGEAQPQTPTVKPTGAATTKPVGTEAVVAPGDRVTVTRGVHAGKGASVVGRTRNGMRLKFDDGSQTTLSAKVIERGGKSAHAQAPAQSTSNASAFPRGLGARRSVPEGAARVEAARRALRDAINDRTLTGAKRADTIEQLRERVQFMETHAGKRDLPDSAVHTSDAGAQPEPATGTVVAEAAQTAARAKVSMKEARDSLTQQIDAAIKAAPSVGARHARAKDAGRGRVSSAEKIEARQRGAKTDVDAVAVVRQARRAEAFKELADEHGFVTLDVPGDGKFKVLNTKERLAEFRQQVLREFKQTRAPRPTDNSGESRSLRLTDEQRKKILADGEAVETRQAGRPGATDSRGTTTETPPAPPKGGVSASGAITDIGEKIGGARKDTATKGSPTRKRAATEAEGGDNAPGWRKRYEVTQIVRSSNPTEEGRWSIHDKRQKGLMRYLSGRDATSRTFATKAEAEAAIPLIEVARNHRTGLRDTDNWGIYRRISDRKRVWVKDGFKTDADAMRYMAQHAVDLIQTKTSIGEEALPKPDNVTRSGPDRRTGDVAPAQFREAFGFRGVEFGNWNNQAERQAVMNHAFDGLHDLAELLGIPPKAISLNGELGLAFGARGQGLTGARAHYERNRVVMNLTKMQGAGALAHEWFHALDHYLGREGGTASKQWVTEPDGTRTLTTRGRDLDFASRSGGTGLRDELREAFRTLINTMHRTATTFVRDSGKLEQFTGRAKADLERQLAQLRDHLATEQRWGAKGKRAPASAEQLAEFDAIAAKLVHGDGLELRRESNKPAAGRRMALSMRTTNDDLERLSAILKAVRGRSGFTAQGGPLVDIANAIRRYDVRLKEAADAKVNPVAPATKPTSFRMEAIKADQGRGTEYWSTRHEMAARAFSAYVEDKLKAEGRNSDFLSFGSEGRFVLPIPEHPHPFPQGEERVAIDKAFDTFFKTVKTREDDAGHVAMFSRLAGDRSGARRRGIDAAQLDRRVSFITHAWHGDKPNVRVVDSAEQLPAAARAEGGYERAEGYYDGKDTIYLVRENLRTAADVDRVLARHEVTHYGLDRIMNDAVPGGWKRFTAETQAMRADPAKLDARTRKAMQSTEERYRNADGSPASPDVFAAELPAVMAEQGVHNRLLDRVVAAIRAHLRKWFPNLKLSPREVRQFIVQAHALVASDGRAARARQRAQRAMVAAHAFDKAPDTFYSALDRAVHEGKGMPKKADAAAWKQWLDGAQRRGEFKGSEREWMGLDQWLDEHKGPVTRQELGDFVRDNRVQVREAMHRDEVPAGEGADLRENEDGGFDLVDADGAGGGTTKFGEYTLPGGNNYRELLLTLPQRDALTKAERTELARLTERKQTAELGRPGAKELSADESARLGALQDKAIAGNKVPFRSQHFDEPNIVAHVRMNDRTGPDGEKILHVDEVQSDMHQAGRKRGYFDAAKPWEVFETGSGDVVARFATEQQARIEAKQRGNRFDFGRGAENGAVPDAPFKKTEQWSMLAMKRVLRYAAEHGYDKVTWTTGEQQAERYDQSHQLKSVHVVAKGGEAPRVVTMDTNRGPIRLFVDNDGRVASSTASNARLRGQRLDDVIGKELATKVMDARDDTTLSGNDLKFGGEGMKAFYDRMLPNEIGKYVKKWGAKVGETTFETRPARTVRNEMDLTELGAAPPRDNGTHPEAAETATVHSIDITPAMRDSVLQGQPLFSLPETPTARDYLDQPDVPVIRLRGDEIKGATPADVRKNANEFVRRWLQELARATGGNAVHNDRTGFDIGVTQNRVHHGFVHRGPENVKLVAAMEGMLRNAAPIDRRAHVPPRDEFRQVHTLVAPLDIAGQRFAVKLTVKEGADGNYRLYDHQALKMESPDSTSGTTATGVARSRPMSGDSASIRDMLRAFKGDNAKYVPRDASANHPEKPVGSFSKPAPADPSREPARGMQDLEKALKDADPGGILAKARAWIRGKAEDLRPAALGALQTSHVLELMEHSVPLKAGARDYDRSMHQMDADRQQLMTGAADAKEHPKDMLRKGAVTIAEELRKLAYGTGLRSLRGKVRPEAQKLFNIMHQATLQRMDPSKAYERLTIENAHGDAIPWTPAEVRARLKVLRELMLQRGGDAWADREKLSDEVKYLRNIAKLEAKREADWPKLQAAYDALSPEAKRLYGEVRDWYSQYRDATEEALIKNIEAMDVPETYRRSLVNRMRLRFEEQRREGVYFPLNRDGDYWVSFQDKDGNEGFKMFEQFKDFKSGVRRLRDSGFQIDATGRRSPNAKAKDAPSGTFVREVIDTLQKAKVSEKVQDEVYQTFLRAMPELSMRKHSIHRRNIAGFSEDALRAFAKNSYHGAHQLARLRHAQDMQMTLEAMKAGLDNWRRGENATDERAEPDPADVVKADALYAELQKRHEWIMSPNDQRLANMANSIGFIWYMGASPASALTNLTQIAQTVAPVLGARHGWGKASRMLAAAWRDAARTGGNMERLLKNDDERKAFLQMQQRGDFSKTQSHTLAGLAEGNVLQTSPAWSKTMNAVSWMFHTAELVNREATGMAAYRLARSEGKTFDEAVTYAGRVNAETNFDYSAANRPRYMQGNVQRIALQFKNYSVGMTWLFFRNLHQAFKGATPEERQIAKRTVAGIMGMTALLAGATGLPLYNTIRTTANAANALFGDDDEPWNFDDAFHRWLADNLGQDAARLIAEGPTNYLTGANLASRTSLSNLWIHDDDQRLEGADAYHALLENLAGPMGGITNNFYVAAEDVRRGHLERGIERILPTAVKNTIKSLRYAHEGVNSLRGDPIVPDVSGYEEFLQAIGFQPAKVADQYRINTAMKNYTGEIKDRRGNLMNAYALAVKAGDSQDQQQAMQRIAAFNRAHPEVAVTRPVLMSSLRQRARLSAQAQHGIILNRKMAAQAQAYAGGAQ